MTARLETSLPARLAHGLGRRAISLGSANAVDYLLQFVLPVVLVRCLEPDAFGHYRLLWLAAGTAMAVVTHAMPGSLYYFLPRATPASKRLYINQTLVFLAVAGLIAGWAFSVWNPWLPEHMRELAHHAPMAPAFVSLWVMASMLDLLPTIEERVAWQAKATIGLSLLRTASVSLAAFIFGDLYAVTMVLLCFVAFKFAVLMYYVARHHGLKPPVLRARIFREQLMYAAPFGAAGALYGMRTQADQWVVAALFPVGLFAAFSIATVLGPLVHLFRVSVIYAFLPGMSRLQASGNLSGMLDLNRRANEMVGIMVYPVLAFAFAFSGEIVTLIYTASYAGAAPVMRVYIAGLAALVVELASIMMLLKQGAFTMRLSLVTLAISVAMSWGGAHAFGLAGAALGSVLAIYIDLAVSLRRIARRTGTAIAQLQNWRGLGRSLLFAALSAALARRLVDLLLAGDATMPRLLAGAFMFALVYVPLQIWRGPGRMRDPRAHDDNSGL